MTKKKISLSFWKTLAPLFPQTPPSPKGGRPRVTDHAALNGILFVLQTGIPWEDLPQELGYGSGMTCWRRLRDWHACGVWQPLQNTLLATMRGHERINWARARIDGASMSHPRREAKTAARTRPTAKKKTAA